MKSPRIRAAVVLSLSCLPAALSAQAPVNQRIQARDGDFVFVQNAEQVRVVRRSEAVVRAVYQPAERWLVLMVDYAAPAAPADGIVDVSYRFNDLMGEWPLGERWEGRGSIDEYSFAGEFVSRGVGLTLPTGLIQVMPLKDGGAFVNRAASATLSYRSGSHGNRKVPFDMAESEAIRQAAARVAVSPVVVPPAANPSGLQPIRVGGNIRTPLKLHDVRPVYPQEALAARVTGLVILEAIIGTDGRVTDAKVLRSVPLLDAAAVDAVRQWRFEPTLLNGVPVPVIMTVTVSFNLQ